MKKTIAWPEAVSETKPWTRWWWLGSAVTKSGITELLEEYHRVGLGGVEITSIYGVKGQESENLDYLSPQWLEAVRHTVSEAKRLGMQVDLPPGSGWRIGGDFVDELTAATRFSVNISADEPGCRVTCQPSGEHTKRSGPGGGGLAFNPFSRDAINAAIEHFTPVFKDLGFRAQFHDSWEYESDCCPDFFKQFEDRRGYDFREHLLDYHVKGDLEVAGRVKYDMHLTLAELALEAFIQPWAEWCRDTGSLSRNQAHGSPGHLLDLYAAVDIPETEVFREINPDTPLMSKFASSAGHVAGRRLVSSETATWLKEHFHVTLGDVKLLLDNLFVAGINHHVYHGTAYSPKEAAWPGWLFYASTQFNPQNSFWRDFPKLNQYVTRCQSILQCGKPGNDLLVYFPEHDVLHDSSRKLGSWMAIEGTWLKKTQAMETYRDLWKKGYAFDYASDLQIHGLSVIDGKLSAPGLDYGALLVPPCEYMPVAVLQKLVELMEAGAQIYFANALPGDVPGLSDLQERQKQFRALLKPLNVCEDIDQALLDCGVRRESLVDEGLLYIRRRDDDGWYYFIINQSDRSVDAWIDLGQSFESVCVMDPMNGDLGEAAVEEQGKTRKVRIQLEVGESCILRTFCAGVPAVAEWQYRQMETAHALEGVWEVEFLEGGPELPASYQTSTLDSWAGANEAAAKFAGTAVYRLRFDRPDSASRWILDLGSVHASARIRLNGKAIETLIGPTFQVVIEGLEAKDNLLEIEVTNLAANRIRDMDQQGISWRIFEDINFVTRQYEAFDASGWPLMDSGLMGPVRLYSQL